MKFISEKRIDQVSEQLETSEHAYIDSLEDLRARHPIIFAYLLSENFEVLTSAERDYMFFLLAILWRAIRDDLPKGLTISEKKLGEAEERNWTMLQESTFSRFQDRLDIFFESYPQEDLLAFLEDALAEEEEEGPLTREGREPIFITLKSILDCWVME